MLFRSLWKFPELLYQVYTRRGRVFSVEDEHGSIAEDMPPSMRAAL